MVDSEISLFDLIDIFKQDDKKYSMYWNSEKQRIEGIHLMIDLLNFMLGLDLKSLYPSNTLPIRPDIEHLMGNNLEDVKQQIESQFSKITLRRIREVLKTFKNVSTQFIVSLTVLSPL